MKRMVVMKGPQHSGKWKRLLPTTSGNDCQAVLKVELSPARQHHRATGVQHQGQSAGSLSIIIGGER